MSDPQDKIALLEKENQELRRMCEVLAQQGCDAQKVCSQQYLLLSGLDRAGGGERLTNREYIESLGDVELAKFLYGLTEKKVDCPPAVTVPKYCRGDLRGLLDCLA